VVIIKAGGGSPRLITAPFIRIQSPPHAVQPSTLHTFNPTHGQANFTERRKKVGKHPLFFLYLFFIPFSALPQFIQEVWGLF